MTSNEPGSATAAPSVWDLAMQRCLIVARRHARQEADAEDIAQEALLRAWKAKAQLKDQQRFPSWLAQIVRNEAARAGDRHRAVLLPAEELETADEDQNLDRALDRADIERSLAVLEPHERQLLHLRYGEDMTQPAIADHLGVPEGTIKVQLHRARGKLRKTME